MSSFLKSLQKSDTGLYDSDTGKSLKSYKAIDLKSLCPDCDTQLIVKYIKAKRGLIAQIIKLYEKEKPLGIQTHFFLNETSALNLSYDSVFKSFTYGGDAFELATEIYLNK